MRTLSIVLKRLPGLVGVMLGVLVVTFFVSHLIPTDVARLIAGNQASEEVVTALRTRMGLDQPLPVQFWRYLQQLAQGDLGLSTRTQQPVAHELAGLFPATAELALCALLITVAVALPLGLLSALRRDSALDQVVRVLSLIGISVPTFWAGLLLIQVFYGALGWLPSGGRIDPRLAGLVPNVTGLMLIDTVLAARWDAFVDVLAHLVLPAGTLALHTIGGIARLVRAATLEALGEDHVRTARAAGLPGRRILGSYVMPHMLLPVVTALGLSLAHLLGGAVVTEIVFSWPGVGSHTIEAIAALDFPTIMGFTLLASLVYTLANLGVDLAYLWIDPRLREAAP
jgi:peptide/nickel transport system permease protein